MTLESKTAMAMAPLVPAATAISPQWGIAMALGMLGGWLARTAFSVEAKKPWEEIRRDLLVSLLISGASIIATLFFARLFAADELGVAAIGFAVAMGGTGSVRALHDYIFAPILAAVRQQKKD